MHAQAPLGAFRMNRYSKITEKRRREIVLLRGHGGAFPSCAFCDYHNDACSDDAANFALNKSVLDQVTGEFGEIEVINSGSVFELDDQSLDYLAEISKKRGISIIHFEAHDKFRSRIPALRQRFDAFELKMKIGIESFDAPFREKVLTKGIASTDPAEICAGFQEGNLLFGIAGQTKESMEHDIQIGLKYLERICINIMTENTTAIKPDPLVINIFIEEIMPRYLDDERVDILLNNSDFGVGA